MLSDLVKEWFVQNAMGPMFQLTELRKQTGVNSYVTHSEVRFDADGSNHPVAKELHNKVLRYATWEYIRTVAAPKKEEKVEVKEVSETN